MDSKQREREKETHRERDREVRWESVTVCIALIGLTIEQPSLHQSLSGSGDVYEGQSYTGSGEAPVFDGPRLPIAGDV